MKKTQINDDDYYMFMAQMEKKHARCNKKHLGVCLVLDNLKIITGSNGPPEILKQCNPCPRLNSHSGTDLHLCRAVHAERSALLKAAKSKYSTKKSKLYSYMGVPCKDCLLELIYAGVEEIICLEETYYDELSKEILQEWINSGGKFRCLK